MISHVHQSSSVTNMSSCQVEKRHCSVFLESADQQLSQAGSTLPVRRHCAWSEKQDFFRQLVQTRRPIPTQRSNFEIVLGFRRFRAKLRQAGSRRFELWRDNFTHAQKLPWKQQKWRKKFELHLLARRIFSCFHCFHLL